MHKIFITIIIALFVGLILKPDKTGISILLAFAVSVALLLYSLTMLETILGFINGIADKADIDNSYITVILKCTGICLLGDFVSSLCKDCGEATLALNTEFVSKCSILLLSLPVYADVLNMILKLWQIK